MNTPSFGLLMWRMRPAGIAELLEFQPFGRLLLILCRHVVPVLTGRTL